jgi:hypothetical protein
MEVLRLHRRMPPNLPIEVFGPAWARWISTAAAAAVCPPAPLLASVSALIGHARWARATPSWAEPPHLWMGAVGDSGNGKSPAADCLMRAVLPRDRAAHGPTFRTVYATGVPQPSCSAQPKKAGRPRSVLSKGQARYRRCRPPRCRLTNLKATVGAARCNDRARSDTVGDNSAQGAVDRPRRTGGGWIEGVPATTRRVARSGLRLTAGGGTVSNTRSTLSRSKFRGSPSPSMAASSPRSSPH